MRALVATAHGVYAVDVDAEEVLALEEAEVAEKSADAAGGTMVVILERRPPLRVSHDGGATWDDAGGGLPPGRAVAVNAEDPALVLYAARNRLYLSTDGGVLWRALAFELPEISAVAWA